MATCSKCSGRGKISGQCSICKGTGKEDHWERGIIRCRFCNGTGKDKKCDQCDGTGVFYGKCPDCIGGLLNANGICPFCGKQFTITPSSSTTSTAQTPKPSTPPPAAKPAPAPVQIYKIGDKGPAGGIVFYDKGNNSDGWRYMEVSPKYLGQTEWDNAKMFQVKISGTKAGIGEGKRNTELIIAVHKNKNKKGTAALKCGEYTLNGFSDWFMPSKDELNELFKNQNKVGEFNRITTTGLPGYIWSSTQNERNNDKVWVQYSNQQIDVDKNSEFWVRAVRYF